MDTRCRAMGILLVAMVVMAGCAVQAAMPAPEPVVLTMPEDVLGTWVSEGGEWRLEFEDDGTLVIANALSGLIDAPIIRGTYAFEGAQLHLAGISCTTAGVYRAESLEAAEGSVQLGLRVVEDTCQQGRRDILSTSSWHRVDE